MTDVLGVWLIGACAGLFIAFTHALSDWMNGDSPRETLSAFGRRSFYALLWPVALPFYLVRAIREDKW